MAESDFFHAGRTYDDLKVKLQAHVQAMFPVEGKKHRLVLKGIEIQDRLDPADYTSQKDARLQGRTWSVPLNAQLELVDIASGRVLDRGKIKLIDLPRITQRGSYIVGGSEYMFPIQKRLRSGPYVRFGEDDILRTKFNLSKGRNFDIAIHPNKGHFQLQVDTSRNIALYPVLQALGVDDESMVRAWGREVFANNVVTDPEARAKALRQAYDKLSYEQEPPEPDQIPAALREIFDKTQIDPANAELTIGKRLDSAGAEAILLATSKMLRVGRGEDQEDNRDSLIHNDIVDLSDFVVERFRDRDFRGRIERTIRFNIDRRDKISQIISRDAFQRPVESMFTEAQLSQSPTQTNPLGMISDYTAVTIRGEGGIQQDNALTRSVRALDPSHLGFMDPAHTPEGQGVGTTLHLTVNTRKRGRDIVTRVLDLRSGKIVELTPTELWKTSVAFPEHLKDGKIIDQRVRVRRGGEVVTVKPSEVTHAFLRASHLMDLNTASIPFTSHNNGARVMLASKMGVQAKPLSDPDKPMVQSGVDGGTGTVEEAVGGAFTPKSPVDGVVEKVTGDEIVVSGHRVSIPNYFPLNSNNFYHATPMVRVGERVKKGQVLADTNYTKDGTLAIGKNLLVAYVPYKGMNVEDGVVVSQSASERMTSEHLYEQSYLFDADTILDLRKYRSYFPAKLTDSAAKDLDDTGVIKKGAMVEHGSVLVASMRRQKLGTESQRLARISKILNKELRDDSLIWTKDVSGEVIEVSRRPKEVIVYVRTKEAMRVGDKIAGRYGNKGIVVQIQPDDEMPKDAKGRAIDLLLNPNGVVSRMNLGQIMETTAGRIAEKTGKPFVAKGFGEDSAKRIQSELKKHGLKDHETIHDPVDNVDIPGILVGRQYIYKLEHQATKKLNARGGGVDEEYTAEGQATRGSGTGGRAIGNMELYALLAHGALANVHEMYGVKSNFDPEVWRAIESGAPLPPPRPSYSNQKFTALLKGMGVSIEKRGDDMAMMPFLDRDVKSLTNGEITNFSLMRGKDLKEEKNGLFDPKKAGGLQGDRWTHVRLPEPVPNPTFEKAILSLLRIKKSEFDEIMSGKKKVGAMSRGAAIKHLLSRIDVDKRLKKAQEEIKGKSGSDLNALHREIRYLKALKENKIRPEEYVIQMLPVLPPKFRPVYTLPDGSLNVSDVNFHYQALMQTVSQMQSVPGSRAFDEQRRKLGSELYKAVGGVMGLGDGVVERRGVKGIASALSGTGSPKGGYVHSTLLKRRQDVSGTGVIVANPKLGLDEVGIPEAMAWKVFRPFVVRELRTMGMTPLAAKSAIDKHDPTAKRALENVMENRHVILNRAPTLHKFSVMAFKPRLVPGHAVEITPLVVGGFNADFDGDTMAVHVPISAEANAEASKMLPSKHLYKPGTGNLQPKIEHEYVLGLFKISRPGRPVARRFSSTGEVVSALTSRKIEPNAVIHINGIRGATTPGRVLINESIPRALRDYGLVWTDKVIQAKLAEVDKKAGRDAFVKALQDLANIGRRYAYLMSSSFLLSDLQAMTGQRQEAYRRADIQAERVRMGPGSDEEKDQKIVGLYMGVTGALKQQTKLKSNAAGKSNNLMDMMVAGARGNPDQIRQMVSSVGLLQDHRNKAMVEPVRGTYTEGLNSAEFFQHMYGNRKGMIDKSQSVKDPGALTKQVIVSAAGHRVSMIDCGTGQGISEPTAGTSALDRHLAEDVPGAARRGEMVTTATLADLRKRGIVRVRVRSPLSCAASSGVCVRCYGLDEEGKPPSIGDHVGIKESQGLTEPSTQLAMKTFHQGGAVTGKASLTSSFDRVNQLFTMPSQIRDKAVLAEVSGRVESISPSPYGGQIVTIAGKKHTVPRERLVSAKIGAQVAAGDKITDGDIQPQDMLRLRGLRAMQVQLRDDIQAVYAHGGEQIHAKTIETPVRILTEAVRVTDAGDHPSLVVGDYSAYGQVDAWNKGNQGKRPVRYSHILPGSEYLPHRSDDWAKRMAHNRIQGVLQDAPAAGARAPLTGGGPFANLLFEKRIPQDPFAPRGLTSG